MRRKTLNASKPGRPFGGGGLGMFLSILVGLAGCAWAWGAQPGPNASKSTQPAKAKGQEPDAAALRALIEQKIAQAQQQATTQPSKLSAPTREMPQRTVRPNMPAAQPAERQVPIKMKTMAQPVQVGEQQPTGPGGIQPTQQRVGKRGGCGAKGGTDLDLTPPPPDQPQPVWSCEQETIELNNVWTGQSAEFVFKIKNEGEGVLNINLKGG